jgi:hypothetical protein
MRRRKPKFGAVECYYCGNVVDIGECEARTIEIQSGRSGTSVSVGNVQSLFSGKGFKPTLRVNSGRLYYRNKDIYMCQECVSIEKKEYWKKFRWAFLFLLFALFVFPFLVLG